MYDFSIIMFTFINCLMLFIINVIVFIIINFLVNFIVFTVLTLINSFFLIVKKNHILCADSLTVQYLIISTYEKIEK